MLYHTANLARSVDGVVVAAAAGRTGHVAGRWLNTGAFARQAGRLSGGTGDKF